MRLNGRNYSIVDICDELRNHPNFRTERNGDPIYNDIQCGNGPANDAADEAGCPGRVDLGSGGCDEIGPRFDMAWLESRERFGGTPNNNNGDESMVTCNGGQSVTYGMGRITMAGGSFYQIFDEHWNEVYNCGWQCGNSKTVDGLNAGAYRIHIKNENYQVVCEQEIMLSNGSSTGNGGGSSGSNGANTSCGEVTLTYGNGSLDMVGQVGKSYFFKINDLNNGWAHVFDCSWNCGNQQTATGLPNSNYLVTIFNEDWSTHCEVEITMTGSSFRTNAGSRTNAQLNFEAYRSQREVALQWLTNSGFKVTHFEVEHSNDGINFAKVAQFVNKIWTNELEYHQTTDLNPVTGANYYRLKEVYLDGSFAYTNVQLVNFSIDLAAFSVFPTPAQEELFISLSNNQSQTGTLTLLNQFGQIMKQIEVVGTEADLIKINTAQMDNGLYLLNVNLTGQPNFTEKVLIHRLD